MAPPSQTATDPATGVLSRGWGKVGWTASRPIASALGSTKRRRGAALQGASGAMPKNHAALDGTPSLHGSQNPAPILDSRRFISRFPIGASHAAFLLSPVSSFYFRQICLLQLRIQGRQVNGLECGPARLHRGELLQARVDLSHRQVHGRHFRTLQRADQ